jgi:hypothetical protein
MFIKLFDNFSPTGQLINVSLLDFVMDLPDCEAAKAAQFDTLVFAFWNTRTGTSVLDLIRAATPALTPGASATISSATTLTQTGVKLTPNFRVRLGTAGLTSGDAFTILLSTPFTPSRLRVTAGSSAGIALYPVGTDVLKVPGVVVT